ncbi:MAG: serine/threonine-protein kinase, partial [Clostridiales bacterium]
MKNEIIYNYEPLWGEWKVEELLGKGSIGSVYKLSRDFFGEKQYSAVKVMSIPTEEQYNMYISSSGHSGDSKEFFEDLVKQIAKEINLLYQLKGHSNIITYEDHMIKNVGEKWHIFIRMECATCLSDYMANKTMETKEILQLGIDMCKALEFCHNRGIMHRDVKEENIFVSLNSKSFKLGDFSVSKETDSLSMAQTKVGTLNYMPPEIINGKTYNKNVDLYSLGLVLYKLLNKGRLPFLPNHPVKISINDIEQSYIKRLRGDVIPKPLGVNNEISNIILKACEYNPLKRYQNVEELKRELEKIFLNFSYLTDNTDKTSESIDETIGADLYNQNNLINQQNQNSYNNYLNNQQNQNSYNNNSNNQQNQNNFNNSLNSQQNQNSYNRNLNNQQNQN